MSVVTPFNSLNLGQSDWTTSEHILSRQSHGFNSANAENHFSNGVSSSNTSPPNQSTDYQKIGSVT
jgi:hypothetical protein